MSKGIGFAGLGKHLAERTLGLLKGRKQREAESNREDLRMSDENKTDYVKLMEWQRVKRKHNQDLRRILFISVISLMLLFLIILLTLQVR